MVPGLMTGDFSLGEQLKALFGYNAFREHQEGIVTAILGGRDVLAILPTGAGKSICYQLPGMLMPGIAVVVSPLISLMQDQVVSLSKMGIPAAFLNSTLPYEEIQMVMCNLGNYKLLYVAPERFADANFLRALQEAKVSFFAIDEAHCISQWGHSFRPDYRQLSVLKRSFTGSAIVALTATATRDVESDIIAQLALQNLYLIRASFDRPNLSLYVREKSNASSQLRVFLNEHSDVTGIIYAATRKMVDETYDALISEGYKVEKYHAGMTDTQRANAQHNFVYGNTPLIVATVAFGMGIHKPDIRFIIHLDMPRSLEQYYQEVGRAGRDGLPAECLMLYSGKEIALYNYFLQQITDNTLRRTSKLKTEKIYAFCRSRTCLRKELLHYFGETYLANSCGKCENCLKNPVKPHKQRDTLEYDKNLFRELSNLRRKWSLETQVPAFVIFGDRTLIEMSVRYPLTREAFLQINGVGFLKWERYGQSFLDLIIQHCTSNKIVLSPSLTIAKPALKPTKFSSSSQETARLFSHGLTLEQIAHQRQLSPGTVMTHLSEQIASGTDLDITPLVAPERQQKIREAIAKIGAETLTPLKNALPEDFTYNEIRLVAAFYRKQ